MTTFTKTKPLFLELTQAYRYFCTDVRCYMDDDNWPTFYDKLQQAEASEAAERRDGATGCVGACDGAPLNCIVCMLEVT